ncbi:unnamed protein product [Schistocephalus solidus]|uniref:Reverse transcriptase domain-containing protein n=1 Tax=Schistocephalus solidus TaxID=70667 RepID=A0A183SR31_SCHSO|nr:unnamed protein product [Schistocephalus solidus]
MMARATDAGTVSEAFALTNGVKQGLVLPLILFRLMFTAMLMDVCRDKCHGIRIAYRVDSNLLDHRQKHSRHQPPPTTAYNVRCINFNGAKLQAADIYTYLSSSFSRSTKLDYEVGHRICKARQAFGHLQNLHLLEPIRSPLQQQQQTVARRLKNTRSKNTNEKQQPRLHPPRRILWATREQPTGMADGAGHSGLVRYKVDIDTLSGTRFSDQGQLEELGVRYTFWGGRPQAE